MIEQTELFPGIVLQCHRDNRFKHGSLSIQFVRPMDRKEAALNALLPAVLLRGSRNYPDLRAITLHLDDLYGAHVGTTVRRVGDYQTTGLGCGFLEDRFALPGDRVLEPMLAFLRELLLDPLTEDGIFRLDYVQSEKKNLLAAIEAQRNDKRAYANDRLVELMCPEDSYGVPRLGDVPSVKAITARSLWDQYQILLRESHIQVFYTGSLSPEQVCALLKPLFAGLPRTPGPLPPQTSLMPSPHRQEQERMDVTQGKLSMGFVTPITLRDPRFVAMQVMNMVFGGSMTNKLFMTVREEMSLCYDIGSGYYGSKGLLTVSAGLDFDKFPLVRDQVMEQLSRCVRGQVTAQELEGAKQALICQLQAIHDSPSSIESYYGTAILSGLSLDPVTYREQVAGVTPEQVMEAAKTLELHSIFFLKGVD